MRYAVFFAPPPEHPLWKAASLWLGRDALTGEHFGQVACGGFSDQEIRDLTAAPRRYGFHATLQAPFYLAGGCRQGEVEAAFEAACRALEPVCLPHLSVTRIGAFFALTPSAPSARLNAVAGEIVRRFDRFRAPPSAAEIERRHPESLSLSQRENLDRWGYPYVFDDYRFHMTLTGPVPEERRGAMKSLLETRFAPVLDQPMTVGALSLFVEPDPPGDFYIRKQWPMTAMLETMDAT